MLVSCPENQCQLLKFLDRFFYGVDFGYRHDFYYGFSSGRMDFKVYHGLPKRMAYRVCGRSPNKSAYDASDTADSEEAYFRKPIDKQTELGAVTVSQCLKSKKGEGIMPAGQGEKRREPCKALLSLQTNHCPSCALK